MAGSNNFLQWNPNALNQQTDGQYVLESMRTGGAISGIFAKEIANKLFFQCTTMVASLGEMLSNKGYVVSDANITTLISVLANILTKADFGSSAGTVCEGDDDRLNEAGMRAWFGQNTAPTGWTIDATAADGLLAVKGGTAAYNTIGGTQAGTWTQPNHLHTTSAVALTEAQLPTHNHGSLYGIANGTPTGGAGGGVQSICLATSGGVSTTFNGSAGANVGSGSTHAHGDTGNSATANTWRPLANVGIVCIKN